MTKKNVKVALIGYGRHMGHSMLPNLVASEDSTIVAVCDSDEERVNLLKNKIPGVKGFSSVEDLIAAKEQLSLDAVAIALTPQLHAKYTELALKNGLHVFVEKPVAIHAEDLDESIKIAEANRLVTCVGTKWRYTKATSLAQNWLKKHKIGVRLINMDVTFPTSLIPAIWGLDEVQTTFYDMYIHLFDYINSWIPDVSKVEATKLFQNEKMLSVEFRFYGKDTIAIVSATRGSDTYEMDFTGHLEDGGRITLPNLIEFNVVDDPSWLGTEGSLRDKSTLSWSQGRMYRGYTRAGYIEEWNDFITAIQEKSDTPTNLTIARRDIQQLEECLKILSEEVK